MLRIPHGWRGRGLAGLLLALGLWACRATAPSDEPPPWSERPYDGLMPVEQQVSHEFASRFLNMTADRYDRRKLLALAAVFAVAAPLVMLSAGGVLWLLNGALLIWGGVAVAFYSIALTELGARYAGNVMAQANAAERE